MTILVWPLCTAMVLIVVVFDIAEEVEASGSAVPFGTIALVSIIENFGKNHRKLTHLTRNCTDTTFFARFLSFIFRDYVWTSICMIFSECVILSKASCCFGTNSSEPRKHTELYYCSVTMTTTCLSNPFCFLFSLFV